MIQTGRCQTIHCHPLATLHHWPSSRFSTVFCGIHLWSVQLRGWHEATLLCLAVTRLISALQCQSREAISRDLESTQGVEWRRYFQMRHYGLVSARLTRPVSAAGPSAVGQSLRASIVTRYQALGSRPALPSIIAGTRGHTKERESTRCSNTPY